MDFLYTFEVLTFWVIYQFKMIFPYWAAGVLAGSLISVFASARLTSLVSRLSGKKLGLIATIPAAMLGAASPICMYGTIPLIASLGRKGVPQYLLAAFMISSILINPNLFLNSFALGAPVAVIRLVLCIIAGVTAGLLVSLFFKNKKVFNFEDFEERKRCNSGSNQLLRLLSDINRAIIKTAPYFLIGIFLAALYQCYFPKDIMGILFGRNNGFGVIIAASLGIPVYVCGGGTIPLLSVWMDTGMSTGSAMAFMITGPATKITNLSAVKIILGAKNFTFYIAFNIIFAIITGFIVDLFYTVTG